MNVVTYARVSTPKQGDAGESLENQRRAFATWRDHTGHTVLHHYEDTASAKNVVGRVQFRRMIAELPKLKPDMVVIDTMDRFTRNLRDGLNLLEELRGHGARLLPLDWRRNRPIDLDDDRDWSDVVEEFAAAERERRRIRRRVLRSYEGRRERGATTTNRPAFGLRKMGDRLAPDPETIWLIHECEKRALRGEAFLDIERWVGDVHDGGWGNIRTLRGVFANEAYVRAGARSIETQRALNDLLELRRGRFGQRRKHENEFTGVFLCGHCLDNGRRSMLIGTRKHDARMKGYWYSVLVCSATDERKVGFKRHNFSVAQSKFEDQWLEYIDALVAAPAFIERWAQNRANGSDDHERELNRRLAEIDQQAAALKKRRDRALDLLGDKSKAVQRQVRKALQEVETDEMELAVARQTVLGELAAEPAKLRDPDELRSRLMSYRNVYAKATVRERNELNRALCSALGGHPKLYRFDKLDRATIEWPEVDALRQPLAVKRSKSRGL